MTLGDVLLVIWALAWDVHALATAPLALFDANVFHPARWALARSDHFLGNLPVFAPIYLVSRNAVLGHQTLLLLTFPLSALAMCVAVRAFTGSLAAGFVAGLCFGLAPWRFVQLAHVQLLSTFYVPLALLAAWAAVARGGARWGVLLAVATALQALCSVYLGLTAFVAAGAMIVGTWLAAPRGAGRRAAGALAAVALAALVVVAVSWPYVALGRAGAIPEAVHATAAVGTPLELASADPLATYVVPYRPGSPAGYYFLGWGCIALAIVGLAAGTGTSRAGLALMLLVGWLVSLGYARRLGSGAIVTLPLGWLAHAVPSFGSFRAPVRLGVIVGVAAAALAGVGYARLERSVGSARARALLLVATTTVVLLGVRPGSVPLRTIPTGSDIPPVYRWLASAPPGPVLELPVGFLEHDFLGDVAAVRWQSGYEYFSTVHWRPLLNGYSGYPPASFFFLMAIARRLPAADALADLVDLSGVRWLVVHRGALPPAAREPWSHVEEADGLVRRAELGTDVVFEVTRAARRDLRPLLQDERPRDATLAGLPRAPLPPGALRGEVGELEIPRVILAGAVARGTVTVRNTSDRPWPGFDPVRNGLVGVAYRWRAAGGAPTDGVLFTRLGRDLAPGETMRLPFGFVAPPAAGPYQLTVTLRQDGGPWFDEAGIAAALDVTVRPWPGRGPSPADGDRDVEHGAAERVEPGAAVLQERDAQMVVTRSSGRLDGERDADRGTRRDVGGDAREPRRHVDDRAGGVDPAVADVDKAVGRRLEARPDAVAAVLDGDPSLARPTGPEPRG